MSDRARNKNKGVETKTEPFDFFPKRVDASAKTSQPHPNPAYKLNECRPKKKVIS